MPNNRQWALFIWLAVFAIWTMTQPKIRKRLRDVLHAALSFKLLVPFAGLVGWAGTSVWLGWRGHLWSGQLGTDTIIWFCGSAVVLFGNSSEAYEKPHFFRRKALAVLGVAVLLQGVSELVVLSLSFELAFQPILGLLAGVSVVTAGKPAQKPAKSLADGVLGIFGLVLFGWVVFNLVNHWSSIDKVATLRQLALPVWLTIALLPFIYAVGVYGIYELTFLRVGWKANLSRRAALRARWVLFTSFGPRAHELRWFGGQWPQRLAAASSVAEGRRRIQEFRRFRHDEALALAEARDRLVRFAGVNGVNESGRRLDRREFEATTEALEWLATCQMGWYRNQGERYRSELLDMLGDDFSGQGLPQPSGIALSISDDGQSWYAWRRTVTGWCFAIGASGPPPDQWRYDGPEPPSGFPGADAAWGSEPFSDEAARNWSEPAKGSKAQ